MQPIAYFAVLALTPHGETGMKAVHYRKALPALLGLLLATAAPAANTGFYLGGDLGRANVAYDPYTFNLSGPAVGYDLAAGYRPIDALAGELSYTGFGRATSGPYYVDTSAVGVFALGYLPVPVVDLYGRLGVADWRSGANSPGYSITRTGADVAYGAGGGMHFGNLSVRIQYTRFTVSHASDVDLASVGLTWTLL
jgi:hypothetical protein